MRKTKKYSRRHSRKIIRNFRYYLMRFDFHRIATLGFGRDVPQRQLAVGYLSYIAIFMALISLPFSMKTPVSFIDNLFTVTSAISTTGLGTVDLSASYTPFGQAMILLMIQVGGLGYMTLTSFILYQLTNHFMRIKNGVMQTAFSIPVEMEMKNLVRAIIYYSLIFELIGSVLLWMLFYQAGIADPLWNGVFHAVSAFCTAGFSLFSDNLIGFATNPGVCMVIAMLSYAGAMGFILMLDLSKKISRRNYKLTLTSKVILIVTTIITVFGTLQLYFFEPSFQAFAPADRLLVSFFQTMSAMTTVGFNSVTLSPFVLSSLFSIMVAMFIGASPSGTGGGVKSTAICTVVAYIKCKLSMQRDVYLFSKRLPTYRIDSALTNLIFYGFILACGIYALTYTETFRFEQIIFEATSALGTVGLSTGITAQFTPAGKLILIILMYVGRLGVLAFGTSMLLRMSRKERNATDPENRDIAV